MIPTPSDDSHGNRAASSESREAIRIGDDALRHLFAGCCEYAFQAELGVADPRLIDYMVDLLMRFARSEAFAPTRDPQGRRLSRITELIAEAEQREGRPRRDLHQHIGDVTLFWTGVYPEALPKVQAIDSPDFFVDLPEQGRRCYMIAGEYEEEPNVEDAVVLRRIADEYPTCQQGLTLARQQWETLRN